MFMIRVNVRVRMESLNMPSDINTRVSRDTASEINFKHLNMLMFLPCGSSGMLIPWDVRIIGSP